jgi:hypothetical protein
MFLLFKLLSREVFYLIKLKIIKKPIYAFLFLFVLRDHLLFYLSNGREVVDLTSIVRSMQCKEYGLRSDVTINKKLEKLMYFLVLKNHTTENRLKARERGSKRYDIVS